jgi:hypothetical protein
LLANAKNKWEELLIFLSIFISSIVFFKQPFEGYFHYLIFILFLPFFIVRYGLPIQVIKFLLLPVLFGFISLLMGYNNSFNFIKIFVGLLLSCSFYFYVLKHYDFNVLKLFRIFILFSKITVYIGILQIISFLIGFKTGYDFSWIFNKWGVIRGGVIGIRVNSIFSEPAQFSIMISPLIYLSFEHLISRKYIFLSLKECLIMILVFLLSTSTTGYLGIAIIVFVILLNMRRFIDAIVITILVYFLGTLLFDHVDEFKSRLNSYSNILSKNELTMDDINSSSFVQYNNFIVAINNFKENPISGTGLGSFPIAYEKYSLTKADDFLIKKGFDFNSQDGNSLLIRALAETGLIGIIFLILIVFKCFVLKQKKYPSITNSISSLISGAFLTLILLTYFRQGNYFLNGFPFFMWMYYYNGKQHTEY